MEVKLRSFFTTALDGDEWSASPLGRFTQGIEPRYPLYRRFGVP